jgi:PAS domain S-box-containing protein
MKTAAPLAPPSETHLTDDEYRLLWATSTDAIVIMDEQGTIRYANPATLDVFGYSAARLVGNNIAILQPEHLREAHRRRVMGVLRNGNKKLGWRAAETVGLHRQGHEFPIEIAFNHLSRDAGRNVFAAFIRDISDRKKIEDALRQREAQLAEAQELAKLGSWSWDVPLDAITWSHELLRISGLPAAPGRFAEVLELVPPEDRAGLNEAVRRSIEDDEPYDMNVRLTRPDGLCARFTPGDNASATAMARSCGCLAPRWISRSGRKRRLRSAIVKSGKADAGRNLIDAIRSVAERTNHFLPRRYRNSFSENFSTRMDSRKQGRPNKN